MHARLAHRVLHQAKVQAFKRRMVQMEYCGGLVLGDEDNALRHRRRGKPIDRHEQGAVYPNRLSGEFLYGGPIHWHFGHFMAEMVHRIVPSKLLYGAAPFIFVTEAGRRDVTTFETLPRFVRETLVLLGVTADFQVVAENTEVEQLAVVEQGSEPGLGPKPGYLYDLDEYVTPRLDALHCWDARPKKVYVSRARLATGLFLGESYLEEQLAAEGFAIVYPEVLPLSVQMDIYRKADVLVFAEGSACHGVELLGAGSLRRCYVIHRRETHSDIFQRVLEPRAEEFACSTGHPYLGSQFSMVGTQSASRVRGVNVFDTRELVRFFRSMAVARLPDFSEADYRAAAEQDLKNHLKGSTLNSYKVLRRILRRVLPNWNGRGTRPGARRELSSAFRSYLVSAGRRDDDTSE